MSFLKYHPLGFCYYINPDTNASSKPGRQADRSFPGVKRMRKDARHRKFIFLDRDGVINFDSDEYIKNWSEFNFCNGSLEAFSLLEKNGILPVLISNQSGIGRGIIRIQDLEEITLKMIEKIRENEGDVWGVFYCPHLPDDGCQCRKPRTAMLKFAEKSFSFECRNVFFVGNRESDVQAALNFGCVPIFIDNQFKSKPDREKRGGQTLFRCDSLLTAVKEIVLGKTV